MDCQNSLGMRVISPPLKKDYVNIYWISRVVFHLVHSLSSRISSYSYYYCFFRLLLLIT